MMGILRQISRCLKLGWFMAVIWLLTPGFTADFSEWTYSRPVYINTSATGANITDSIAHFPLLIRLNDTNMVFGDAQPNGADLRFEDSAGTELAYELTRWDNSAESAWVWVLLDTLMGADDSQYVTMYWGNGSATSNSSGENTFSTSDGYQGVWHFDNSLLDATSNSNDGSDNGTTNTTTSMIGDARDFDGSSDVQVADHSSLDNSNKMTWSVWVRPTALGGAQGILGKRISSADNVDYAYTMFFYTGDDVFLDIETANDRLQTVTSFANNNWYHVMAVFDGTLAAGSRSKIYRNGVLDVTATETSTGIGNKACDLVFGKLNVAYATSFSGIIDEARIENTARSADWVKLCWVTQKSDTTILAFGAVDTTVIEPRIWDGGGADAKWSNHFNWSGDVVPDTSDRVEFSGISSDNCSLDVSITVKKITFSSGYTGQFHFGAETLSVKADVDFSTGGTVAAGTGVLKFTGGGSFTPKSGAVFPDINVGATGTVTIKDNNMNAGALVVSTGTLNLGTALTHSVTDISGSGTIDFGTSTLQTSGSTVTLNSLAEILPGSGYLDFTGGSAQTLTPPSGDTLPGVIHSGSGTLTLSTNMLQAQSFSNSSGPFDFGGNNVLTTGNFYVSNGTAATFVGLGGRTITIGGNGLLVGQASNELNLHAPGYWTINCTGALNASYCNIDSSDARPGSMGHASNSITGLENTNWVFDTDNYTQWDYNRTVFINTTVTGAAISGTVNNYPLLIRLDSDFPFAQAKGDGRDIRFAKTEGTHLDYEIEDFDSANAAASLWVLVDQIAGNSKTQKITIYWGNDTAANNSNPSSVFATGNNFQGVWHLHDDLLDATTNNIDGGTNNSTDQSPALVGDGQNFGGNHRIIFPDNDGLDATTTLTASIWVYPTTLDGAPDGIMSKRTGSASQYSWSMFFYTGNKLNIDITSGAGANRNVSNKTFTINSWYYVSMTYSSGTVNIYVDGALDKTVTGTTSPIPNTTSSLHFGMLNDAYGQGLHGNLDEGRVSNTVRSADWVLLDYQSQKAAGTVINMKNPVVSGLGDTTAVSAFQNDSDSVYVRYEVEDPNSATVTITLEYKLASGGSWTAVTDTAGDIGTGIAVSATADKQIMWSASDQWPAGTEDTYLVRVIADDGANQDTTVSGSFSIDVKAPVNLASLASTDTTGGSVTLSWTAATDANFNHYEIWYGKDQAKVAARNPANPNGAMEWDQDQQANLVNSAITSAVITGLSTGTTYYFKIWAIDDWGRLLTPSDINVTTKALIFPDWSKNTLGTIQGASAGYERLFVGTGNKMVYSINEPDGGTRWSYDTDTCGVPRMPTYIHNGAKYEVYLTAGTCIIGLLDNENNASEIFTPFHVGATPGVPYTSTEDSTFYVIFGDSIGRYRRSNGGSVSGWPKELIGARAQVDILIANDDLYMAAGNFIYRYDNDGTQQNSFDALTTISLPLLSDSAILYLTPDNNRLYALNMSNFNTVWTPTYETLSGTNSGPAFFDHEFSRIYVATGTNVESVEDQGASSNLEWTYPLAYTVNSGPLLVDTVVYFGSTSGRYHAISKNTRNEIAKWPYTGASGNASLGPWVPGIRGRIIFGTDGGNLDAFDLQ